MLRFRSFQSHSPIEIVLVTWLASPIRVSSALASLGSFCSAKSHCLGLSLCDTLGIEPLGDLIPIGEQKNRDLHLGLYHSPIGIRTPTKGTKILFIIVENQIIMKICLQFVAKKVLFLSFVGLKNLLFRHKFGGVFFDFFHRFKTFHLFVYKTLLLP